MSTIGNPAPLGLLAFGMTTLMLMYVEMEWCEKDFEVIVAGTAMALGGAGQVLVAIFEILKGSSFPFAVFGSYGFFWLGWAFVYFERNRKDSYFQEADYKDGATLWFTQWGILTSCFWVITWRKNKCLIFVFTNLLITFFLLAIANARDSVEVRKAGGYFGFVTACGAFYTGVAELINEEYGRHLLPGLMPVCHPQRLEITTETIADRIDYDAKSNTLLLQFRGLQIKTRENVDAIEQGVENAILAAKSPDNRVHVVADYSNTSISEDVQEAYWEMAKNLETKYYLSATRFNVSSFGTVANKPMAAPTVQG